MSNGTYEDFRAALLAFESGWDRARYDAGIITDAQLDQWAGGPVATHFPGCSSWAELTEAEWAEMAYRSTNALGFVGYQFGEALLIDLGYYEDDVYYGAGAATNTWDGTWTGKNGVDSLSAFMTADAQETAIQEAFGYNLKVIRDGLAASGQSLEALLGTTATYTENGATVAVELTLTGIMAAAHLRGAWGTLALLQDGAVSSDENGTSILKYIAQFGGYDAPTVDEAIAVYETGTAIEAADPAETGSDAGTDTALDTAPDAGTDTETDTTGADSTDAAAPAQPIVAAYFPEWGVYGRDYTIADVPADQLTHLIYAFAQIDASGRMALYDAYAATDKAFTAADSVDGVADTWEGQDLRGNFNQIAELKALHPHLRTSIAVGGWTLSGSFSTIAATGDGRAAFAASVVDFLTEYDMFDGIDLDWEYPGGGGLESNAVSPADGANYALLIAEIRAALDGLSAETGRSYEISVAAPAGHDKIENFNLAGLDAHVDFFNMMAYDFYGAWQNTTGHQAAIFDMTGAGYDIATAVDLYLDAGIDAGKIVLGAPMYTRAWQGVSAGSPIDAWNAQSGGAAPGTFEAGVYDYKDLLAKIQDPDSGWKLCYDDDSQAAFVWNEALGIFSSIETPQTIALKSEWAQAKGLGGMMFWDLSNDATGDAESLLKAAADSWIAGLEFDEIAAGSTLDWDGVFGGDGVVAPIAEADTPAIDLGGGTDDAGTGDAGSGDAGTGDTGTDGAGTGDTGTGDGTGDAGSGDTGSGAAQTASAGVTAATADVVISWTWGAHTAVDFDPAADTIYIDWIGADALEVYEEDGSAIFAVPSNDQSVTLTGVPLSALSGANFTIMDPTAEAEVLGLIGGEAADAGTDPGDPDPTDPDPVDPDPTDPGTGDPTDPDPADPDPTEPDPAPSDGPVLTLSSGADVVTLDWSWAERLTIRGFDAAEDVFHFGAFSDGQVAATEQNGDLVFEVLGNGGDFTVLEGVSAADLAEGALQAAEWSDLLAPGSALSAQLEELGWLG